MSDFITNGELRIEAERLCDENERLQAENAKLRELVRDIMLFLENGDYCMVCEKSSDCDAQAAYDNDCLMRDVFHKRMSELGIEVYG